MFASKENTIDSNHHTANNGKSTFFKPRILPKLTINPPNDVYEQEADAMSEIVMRMPADNPSFFSGDQGSFKDIQRKCAACEEEEKSVQRKCTECEQEEKNMQRKESSADANAAPSIEQYLDSLSGGQGLGSQDRSFYESRMGYDFNNVRIHTNQQADVSAKSVNALAYTHGNNIVFRAGQYNPDSESGKRLLAHELTHVVQQQGKLATPSIQRGVYVCDEYKYIPTTSYHPGPGINLSLSGNSITISADIELYGGAATNTIATDMKSTIEGIWTATFTGGYSVNTTTNISVQGASPDDSKTRIEVLDAKGVSNVKSHYWIVGSRYMQYYTQSSNINWTPAHEFGHLLGLPDHYSESILSKLKGKIDPTWRTTPEDKGWEGNLMAKTGGALENKNLEELVSIGFRPVSKCVKGHMESPL